MAELDPTLREPTPTSGEADRVDAYRLAIRLIREAELIADAAPADVLEVAQFIYNG